MRFAGCMRFPASGSKNKILHPAILAGRSVTVQHISQSLNFGPCGNYQSCVQNMSLILQQPRPVQYEVVVCTLANRSEIREVRLTRRGGNEYGSEDGYAGKESDQNHRAHALRSRDGTLLSL